MSHMVDSTDYSKKRSCGFASLLSPPYDLLLQSKDSVPMSLQWSTPIPGSCHFKPGLNSSCSFDGLYCWQNLSTTHLCVCSTSLDMTNGYSTVCKEENCGKYKYCHMLCFNTPGRYCSRQSCPVGYQYNNTGLRCEPEISSPGNSWNWNIIIIGIC
ncbi:hypothetical protein HRI_003883200 [Hibiscus trionum]|uniref:Uncharacterized protein n=1 Tax=Hibiscus trionum TaxID=183268 RepID=A0A9W7MJL7_HIBTR|nr:hypothetical protein HRI_003883200 [Hibiscus trionum]